MKRILFLLSVLPLFCFAQKDGYSIKIRIKPLKDSVLYFGNYYGDKQYVKDTARIDANGNAVFDGKEKLPGGIYLVVLPSKKFMEVIVDKEQNFSLETDTNDLVRKMNVKGSEDNKLFYKYLSFIADRQKDADPLRKKLEKTKDKDSIKTLQEQLGAIDKKVKDYKADYVKEHSETLLAKVFTASQDPEVPKAPILPNGRPDSLFTFLYYKSHYFDNVDFSDDRLLRTPVLYNKMKYYLDKLVLQLPDSIIKEADMIIGRTNGNKETFKYCVYYCTYTYETSPYMGMDAVFVHMVNKYYKTGQAYWVDEENLKKILDKAKILEPLLIGKTAPPLFLPDTLAKVTGFTNIKSPYLILYFWDPECGHCKKATPKLKAFYDKFHSKGFEVYAVDIEENREEWLKYIREHNLNWVNVTNAEHRYYLKEYYDVYSTPVIYLLDENKKIIAKRIDADQLEGFVTNMLKQKEKKK
ncbi:MAG TPA: thioredoxin-like domain-containing protein [Bacteroidia bacterium]